MTEDTSDTKITFGSEKSKKFVTQFFPEYRIKKELKVILVRCDENETHVQPKKEPTFEYQTDDYEKLFYSQNDLEQGVRVKYESNPVPVECPSKNFIMEENNLIQYEDVKVKVEYSNEESNSKPLDADCKKRILHCKIEGCDKTFKTTTGLNYHRKFKHENFKYSCEKCGKQFVVLKTHLMRCFEIGGEKFVCLIRGCNSSFVTKSELVRHKKFVHDNFKYTCKICGKKVVCLKLHEDRCKVEGDRKFYCTHKNCNSSFLTEQDLRNHVRNVHRDPVKCPYEDCQSYMKPLFLSRHIKCVHERSERYRCKNCDKIYSNLKRHIASCMSDGLKKFACQIDNCKAVFITKNYLQCHVKSTHATPIKCPHKNCDTLVKPAGLVSHLRKVHDRIRKECEKCGKSISNLTRHMKTCKK